MTVIDRFMNSGKWTRRAVPANRRSGIRPGVEVLEDRRLPAGGLTSLLDLGRVIQTTAISPTVGNAPQLLHPGTTVTVRGSGFTARSRVQFGDPNEDAPDLQATPISVSADGTSLQVQVPRLAIDGPLTVISSSGGRYVTPASFTVNNYRNVNGFSFENFGFNVSWQNMQDAFGKGQTDYYVGSPWTGYTDTGVPTAEALAIWGIAAYSLNGNGACFGMALASEQFQHHPETLGNYALSGTPTVNHLQETSKLVDHIEALHLTQISAEMISNAVTWQTHSHSAGEIRSLLQGLFQSNSAPLISIQESATEGHAVIAYDIETGDGANGFTNDYYIDVYDPNRPFTSAERTDAADHRDLERASRIHVGGSGRWEFDMGGDVWSGDVNGTLTSLSVFAYDKIPEHPTLPSIENLVLEAGSNALRWVLGDQKVTESPTSARHADVTLSRDAAKDADAIWTSHGARLAKEFQPNAAHGNAGRDINAEPDFGGLLGVEVL